MGIQITKGLLLVLNFIYISWLFEQSNVNLKRDVFLNSHQLCKRICCLRRSIYVGLTPELLFQYLKENQDAKEEVEVKFLGMRERKVLDAVR